MRRYGRGIAEVGCFLCCFGQVRGAAEEGFHPCVWCRWSCGCRCRLPLFENAGRVEGEKRRRPEIPSRLLHIQMTTVLSYNLLASMSNSLLYSPFANLSATFLKALIVYSTSSIVCSAVGIRRSNNCPLGITG